MRALWLVLLLASLVRADETDEAIKSLRADDIKKHQTVLASDDFEGREAGSEGGHRAGLYIVEQLRRLGFRPGGPDGGFFQPFGAGEIGAVEGSNFLAAGGKTFTLTSGFLPHKESGW